MTHISDHFPQFMILNKININHKNCSYAKRDFSKFNEQAFISTFAEQNLNLVHDKNLSFNSSLINFIRAFHHMLIIMHLQGKLIRKISNCMRNLGSLPKFRNSSNIVINCFGKLNRKFTKAREYLYKKFRNRAVNELKSSRINYYNNYFTEHKSNMKMLWNGIKSIINIKRKKSLIFLNWFKMERL